MRCVTCKDTGVIDTGGVNPDETPIMAACPDCQMHYKTECCNYRGSIRLPYPVMWNEWNKKVQCHNCGTIWIPK